MSEVSDKHIMYVKGYTKLQHWNFCFRYQKDFYLSDSYTIYNCGIHCGKACYKLTQKQRFQAVWAAAINNTWAASCFQTDAIVF